MNKLQKTITLLFIGLFTLTSFAQHKLDKYGYILIPQQLSFQDKPNEYDINKVLKSSLSKYNFTAFVKGDTIPSSISPCDILHLETDKSGFLSTKIKLVFSDCYGKDIFTSIEGQSRIKEFKPSYYEAIRNTLRDPNIRDHIYDPNAKKVVKEKVKKINPAVVNVIPKNVKKLTLEFKDIQYNLASVDNHNVFNIFDNNNALIGTLIKQPKSNVYILKTNSLNGSGTFDDFGNFLLTRVNPVNNTKITDTMSRTK